MVILLIFAHFFIFLRHPMPGIQTADKQTNDQQHQCPGIASWMVFINPDTKCSAEQRWNHYRPANKPQHAQSKPDALVRVTPRLEFTCHLRSDFPAECSPVFRALDFWFFTHDETLLNGG